jgi:hypothetical protein
MKAALPFRHAILACFILLSFSSRAQLWDWVRSAGGEGSDKALDIDMDKYGNQYVSGYYNSGSSSSDISFGAIIAPENFGKEGFLAKMDSAGNWLWMRQAFGGWDERTLGLCVDKVNDYVYVTGTAWVYTDFAGCPSTTFPGSYDNIYVAKYDLLGNCQWLIPAGGDYDDHGYDLVTDKQGNIYLTGFLGNTYGSGPVTATFGSLTTSPIPPGDSLGFVAKINPAGTYQWVRTFGATDGERDNRIAIDTLGGIYITGGFHGTQSFGSTFATSNGGFDIFVLKYDGLGNQQWLRTTGSALDDRGNGLIVGSDNEVYITGELRDKVVFGTDTVDNNGGPNGRDIFVAKISRSGTWKWAKKAGSNGGSDRGDRIAANKKDLLFVTGQFKGNASFGAADTLWNPSDSVQAFVAAIDTAGKWQWAVQAGSPVEDRGTGIVADDSCNLYICGFYEQTADFGSMNITSLGRKDLFVTKIPAACIHNNVGIKENEPEQLICYPNPGSGHFSIDLRKQYTDISVLVYNVTGEVVIDKKYESAGKIELDLNRSNGIYFIRVMMEDGNARTLRVIKQ